MVLCEVCGKPLRFVTATHLKRHELTVQLYRERYPDSPLMSADVQDARGVLCRRINADNFAEGGNAAVKEKMSRKARVRAKRNADAGTEAYQRFQAASRKFTAELWDDPEWQEKMKGVSAANMRRTAKKLWSDPAHRRRRSERMLALWRDPDWRAKQVEKVRENARKALYAHLQSQGMNKLERLVFDLIEPLGFEYTGDGTFWVRQGEVSMNPDFVRRPDKMIVEFFGDYWHQNEPESLRRDHFALGGWRTVIVWQSEFLSDPTVVLDKLSQQETSVA